MKRFTKTIGIVLGIGLGVGLALALLALLNGSTAPVAAAPAPSKVVGPTQRPLQALGDVYCVTPISQTYVGCTRVFTSVQFAVDHASGGEIVKVAQGTYTDIHQRSNVTQVVYISASVTIRGGYTTTNNFAEPPYPITQPTTLDAGGQGRLVYVEDVTTTLEGLRLTDGVVDIDVRYGGGIRATSPHLVVSGCHIYSNTARDGGGAWIEGPDATFVNNHIFSNTSRVGGGLYLNNSPDAILTDNKVYNNRTIQFPGGGIYVNWSPNVSLTNNDVYSNSSSSTGGGIYIYANSDGVALTGNRIYSNTAQNAGAGIYAGSDDTTLIGNRIYANTTSAGGGGIQFTLLTNTVLMDNAIYSNTANGFGGGANFNQAKNVTLTGNRIYSNTSLSSNGGGIWLKNSPTATLRNNQLYNNTAGADGGAIYASDSPTLTLTGNQISGNSADQNGGGIYLFNNDNVWGANNVVVENRILSGGKGAGLLLGQLGGNFLHTTIARNTGGDGSGVFLVPNQIGIPTSVAFTNTILVSHTVGITVGQGSTGTLASTLWGDGDWANETPAVANGTVISSGNVIGDPSFWDPDNSDYHITGASAGRDLALSTTITDDIDGAPRPFGAGPDIGADEATCHARLNGTYYRSPQTAVDASTHATDVVQIAGTCHHIETRASTQQIIYVDKTLTVRGGYNGDFSAWDPQAYPTVLDAQRQSRVVRVQGGGITPTLEALRLTNGQINDWGGGIQSRFASTIISGCHVYSNTSSNWYGGGIYMDGSPNARLVNNQVYSNNTTERGGGLYLAFSDGAELTGNIFRGNSALSGGGVYLYATDGRWANNIFAENKANDHGGGLYVLNSTLELLHSTFARNRSSGDGSGVCAIGLGGSNYSALALTNTILVSHTVGITVAQGSTATLVGTLWGEGAWVNEIDAVANGTIISGSNVTGDPSFVDSDGGDYHITAASAAVDRGEPTSVPSDIDGDSRIISTAPDLGADESTFVLKVVKSGPAWVNEGTPIAYTLRVTNTGIVTATNVVLTDALPTGSNFVSASDSGSETGGIISWPAFDLLPNGDAIGRTFTVTATETITNGDYQITPQSLPGVRGAVIVTTYVNHTPVAEAGVPQAVYSGTVTLDGSGSSDPDGNPLSYQWTQTGGPAAVSLIDADMMTATFTAPVFGGVYTFTLTVTDTFDASASDDTTVTVNLPALTVSKSGPPKAGPGMFITYTLTVTNTASAAATSLIITDALPAGAGFVSASDGGVWIGGVVSWTVSGLSGRAQVQRTFTVTATETITNADYRVSCAEGVSTVGSVAVVTEISQREIYLPLVLRSY